MKNLLLISVLALLFASCGNQKNQQKAEESAVIVYSVDSLMAQAANLVDQEVAVIGTVSHVCKNGGERCFLMGSNEDIIVRIEKGGTITAFDQAQMGSDIQIKGILREVPIDEEYLTEQEKALAEGMEGDKAHALGNHGAGIVSEEAENEDHGAVKKQQIEDMKEKIKSSDKGYVPVYFIEAISQENAPVEVK